MCIFDDVRMMYLFWSVAGLLAAHIREGRNSEDERSAVLSDELDASDTELRFYK